MIGKILGNRYEIIEKIGEGGMSLIYKAKCSLLQRMVTVKVLRPQYTCDQDFIKRFHREAQAVASLSHPNIVGVYDVGHEGETHYIVMEYIEGDNLKNIIHGEKKLTINDSINIAQQICEALEHAHENGIIHRDIKPHNILITKSGRVKVTDFGIARLATSATVTHSGTIVGSVHYFAPEQARGEATSAITDIYSAGVVLYEMLTGKVPFEGESPIAIALKQIQEDPMVPSKLNPDISEELEKVVLRAMDKDPAHRYQTARDFNNDLKTVLSGKISEDTRVLQVDEFATKVLPKADLEALQKKLNEPEEEEGSFEGEFNYKAKKKKKDNTYLWLGAVAVIILGLMTGAFGYMYGWFGAPEVKVPNVEGKSYEQAKVALEEAGLTVKISTHAYSDKYDKDIVMGQDPEANKNVKAGREVFLTISKGKKTAAIPIVLGKDLEETRLLLESKGFENIEEKPLEEFSDAVETGKVIRVDVPDEYASLEQVPLDTRIVIVVSKGAELKDVTVPSLVGLSQEQAVTKLEELKLKLGTVNKEASSSSTNSVIAQNIPQGTIVKEGTAISITISTGPAAPETKDELVTFTPTRDGKMRITLIYENGEERTQYSALVRANQVINTTVRYTGNPTLRIYLDDEIPEERILP